MVLSGHMSPGAILVVSLAAFLSAPGATILLLILYLQNREEAVRDLALGDLGLAFVLLGNLLTPIVNAFLPPREFGVLFVLLDEVTISSLMLGGFACRFAFRATQTPVTPMLRVAFWAWAFAVHALALAVVLVPPTLRAHAEVTSGFTVAALGSAVLEACAGILIIVKRKSIPERFFAPRLPAFVLGLIPLILLSVVNEIFRFGQRLGGAGIPVSPFATIIVNGMIIVGVSRNLIASRAPACAEGDTTRDFALTLRESEILPLLLDGASNDQIGDTLHISPHTVKNHVTAIYRKTGTENRFDLLKTLKRRAVD